MHRGEREYVCVNVTERRERARERERERECVCVCMHERTNQTKRVLAFRREKRNEAFVSIHQRKPEVVRA